MITKAMISTMITTERTDAVTASGTVCGSVSIESVHDEVKESDHKLVYPE